MTLALLCPKCKSIIHASFVRPKSKLTIPASCPKCGDVDAFIVESGRAKGGANWARDAEPTTLEDEEVELMGSIIPAGGALFSIGNSLHVARFIGLRLLFFGAAFLIFGDYGPMNLQNPYLLVLGSSIFLLLSHIVYLIGGRLNLLSFIREFDFMGFSAIFLGVLALAVVGPLLVFEVLLIAFNPLFFLIDAGVSVISFLLWREEHQS
jgi:hypothetical protein